MQFTEHAVERATTETLEVHLNEASDKGREIISTQWMGGRDWTIISARCIDNDASRLAAETFKVGNVEHTKTYAPLPAPVPPGPDSPEATVWVPPAAGGVLGSVRVGFYENDTNLIEHRGVATRVRREFSGYIEDEDSTWIIFLDDIGRPALMWGCRDLGGGIVGDPLNLRGCYELERPMTPLQELVDSRSRPKVD